MKFDLTRPCKDCPFRSDNHGFLGRSRAEQIAYSIGNQDRTFSCHNTNDFGDDGGAIETKKSQHCAGASIVLEKSHKPNQWMRIAERIGMYDRHALDMDAPVVSDLDAFVEKHSV